MGDTEDVRLAAWQRIAPQGSISANNRRYLGANVTRAGHKLNHLQGVESESVGCDEARRRSAVAQRTLA